MHLEFTLLGFRVCPSDSYVFVKREEDSLVIIAVYIDNMLVFSSLAKDLNKVKNLSKRAFKIMDLGEASWILGMELKKDQGEKVISLSQEQYMEGILECFGQQDSCPISTPSLANQHITYMDHPEVDVRHFQSTLGSMM